MIISQYDSFYNVLCVATYVIMHADAVHTDETAYGQML